MAVDDTSRSGEQRTGAVPPSVAAFLEVRDSGCPVTILRYRERGPHCPTQRSEQNLDECQVAERRWNELLAAAVSDQNGLARRMAQRFADRATSEAFDNWIGAAQVGLVEAALFFDPDRHRSTWAGYCHQRMKPHVFHEVLYDSRRVTTRTQARVVEWLIDGKNQGLETDEELLAHIHWRGRQWAQGGRAWKVSDEYFAWAKWVHANPTLEYQCSCHQIPCQCGGAVATQRDGRDSPVEQAAIDAVYTSQLREVIQESLHTLTTQQRYVLVRTFGLDGREPVTMPELGAELGVTKGAINNMQKRALAKLREGDGPLRHLYIDDSGELVPV